jgi:hypothetical protein
MVSAAFGTVTGLPDRRFALGSAAARTRPTARNDRNAASLDT